MIKNGLLKIIKERLDPSLTMDNIACPFCDSKNVEELGHEQTLVDGCEGNDPNHHWHLHLCKECLMEFTVESKEANVWYTFKNKVMRGIPTCFENYIYTCNFCFGDVYRAEYELDGETKITDGILVYEPCNKPMFRTFYECDDCGDSVESINRYYIKPPPLSEIIKSIFVFLNNSFRDPSKLMKDWKIFEEVGIVAINNYSIDKMRLRKGEEDNANDNG